MKHRIVHGVGFGVTSKCLLDNKGRLNKTQEDFAWDVIRTFNDGSGVDYQIAPDSLAVGVEPTYQGDKLFIITLHRNILKCSIQTGRAFGAYGSGIRSKTKTYWDYKKNCKFTRFVQKWHKQVFP